MNKARTATAKTESSTKTFIGEEVADVSSTLTYESLHVLQQNTTVQIKPKVALQILLLLSGDVERCPGPLTDEVQQDFNRVLKHRGMKLFNLNVRGLWGNLSNISQILSDYKKIDILLEKHTSEANRGRCIILMAIVLSANHE